MFNINIGFVFIFVQYFSTLSTALKNERFPNEFSDKKR